MLVGLSIKVTSLPAIIPSQGASKWVIRRQLEPFSLEFLVFYHRDRKQTPASTRQGWLLYPASELLRWIFSQACCFSFFLGPMSILILPYLLKIPELIFTGCDQRILNDPSSHLALKNSQKARRGRRITSPRVYGPLLGLFNRPIKWQNRTLKLFCSHIKKVQRKRWNSVIKYILTQYVSKIMISKCSQCKTILKILSIWNPLCILHFYISVWMLNLHQQHSICIMISLDG